MRRALIAATLLLAAFAASAQTPAAAPAKEEHVRELLKLIRAGDLGMQMVDGMIESMKQALPGAPDAFWVSFRKRAKPEDLVELLVPIYMKNLDDADLDELIRFYGSPAGQHFLAKQPVIMQDSMKAGQQWGERIAQEAIEEMKKTEEAKQ